MATADLIVLETTDIDASQRFYEALLGIDSRVRTQATEDPSTGFRGFTLSLVVPHPADVDALASRATDAGATVLKPPKKSLWGYGAAVQAPDGTICTLASGTKKDGPATGRVDDLVLQLGVEDVAASKRFYEERGFAVAKSYGKKYVELDSGAVTVTLNKRKDVAKVAGVDPSGSGSHRVVVGSDIGPFTDPDGFVWAGEMVP